MNSKNILVPIDGSENSFRGLKEAIKIAKLSNSKITALYAFDIPPPFMDSIKYHDELGIKAKKVLKKAKQQAQKEGINLEEKIVPGIAKYHIQKLASKKNFELIVIGSRGVSTFKGTLLGSTANHVVHTSKVPVLVVK